MKILTYNKKKKLMKIKVETEEDLYVLEKILKAGDEIEGKTSRSIVIRRGDEKIKAERRSIIVKIKVEGAKLSNDGRELRVKGKIIEGPEDVEFSYHTFEILPGTEVKIWHDWRNYEIDKLRELKVRVPKVLILVLDDEECDIALFDGSLKLQGSIKGVSGRKSEDTEERRKVYLGKVLKFIGDSNFEKLIIVGPGFTKDELVKMIREKDKKLLDKIILDSVSHVGEPGINEVFKRGIIERVVENSIMVKETRIVERFFEALSKNEMVVYGIKEVEEAVSMRAVDTLLISDKLVHDNQSLLESAEKFGAKVKIISTKHDAGKRFLGIGGIGAFLRFRVK